MYGDYWCRGWIPEKVIFEVRCYAKEVHVLLAELTFKLNQFFSPHRHPLLRSKNFAPEV